MSGKKIRKKIHEITPENDLRYRGPLSYVHIRIAAWVLLVISHIGFIARWAENIDQATTNSPRLLTELFPGARQLAMPLFLIAAYATILNGTRTYRSLLLTYGGAALGVYAGTILVYDRYIIGSLSRMFVVERKVAADLVDGFLLSAFKNGHWSFNIFIDLFLCTLLAFFLIYKPKHVFTGKKHYIFRSFALFPVLYEIGSIVVKILVSYGKISIPMHVLPLLTTKPPMTFLVFVLLTIFIKIRERIYRKRGKSHEEFKSFLKTNANSFQFSAFTAGLFVVSGLIDMMILFLLSLILALNSKNGGMVSRELLESVAQPLINCGIGQSAPLILIAPVMLLFSYTRTHSDSRIDIIVPITGISLLAFVYIEGVYHILYEYSNIIKAWLESLFSKL